MRRTLAIGLAVLILGGAGCGKPSAGTSFSDMTVAQKQEAIKAYAQAHPAATLSGQGSDESWLSRDVAQHGTPQRLAAFTGAPPVEARGLVQLSTFEDGAYVIFPPDFNVWDGPSLHVFIGPAAGANANIEQVKGVIDLGPLKATKGPQIYTIPRGTGLAAFGEVVIWSAAFHTAYAIASVQ